MGRKNIFLILLAVAIVILAFVVAEFKNTQDQKVVYENVLSTTTSLAYEEIKELDTDEGGLKDWEEVLLGTDSKKADTDGDGTPDGKEVSLNRNPLVKGPKDTAATNSTSIKREDLSPTDLFARDFFARYMELKQAGLSEDKYSQQELIGQVLKSGVVIGIPKTYSKKDISVITATEKDAVKKYGNNIGGIFKRNSNPAFRNEVFIAKESLEKEDPEILKELDPIINSYKKIINELLKVYTPESLSNTHLELINNMSSLLFSAEYMKKIDTDALSGLQGITRYVDTVKALSANFNSIKNSFDISGITFSPSEDGSFFTPNR